MGLNDELSFYAIGLSYKKADVGVRSAFSIDKQNRKALLKAAKAEGLPGLLVISTCNRTEIIGFAKHPFQLIALLCEFSAGSVDEFAKYSYVYKSEQAVNHFIRIATGLDSQILGDYEIVGQLKASFREAKEAGTVNAYMERLYNVALQASKEVKNSTKLSSGVTTVSYAAVQFIKDHKNDFTGKKMLIYGLGEIGKNTVKSSVEYLDNIDITIVNRTDIKAAHLAEELKINYIPFQERASYLRSADIIIVATGASKPTVKAEDLDPNTHQLIIDISIPSNVSQGVRAWPLKEVVDVDMLSERTGKTFEERKKQIPVAEAVVAKHKDAFYEWVHFRKHAPAIRDLKQALDRIKNDVIHTQVKKHPETDVKHINALSEQMMRKIVAKFAAYLKEDNSQANNAIRLMQEVFKHHKSSVDV